MTFVVRLTAAFAAVSLLVGPASAQTKTPAPGQALVTHFTPSLLIKTLTALGATDAAQRQEKAKDGRTVDIVSFTVGGTKHVGVLSACADAKGCLAVELLTVWAGAGKTANRTALNAYNSTHGFGKGFLGPNGTLVYQRYAISDGGVTMDNLRANIGNFVNGSQSFEGYMSKQAAGTSAGVAPAEGGVHLTAGDLAPTTETVILSLGASQGLNALKIPVEQAPSKSAQ
jgi:hypothetical protein